MLQDENPSLVWDDNPGAVPLVLVHDGGGTSFAYHCLNPLGRPLYAIHNPRFYTREPWAGGIAEMARHYVALLRAAVPARRVLLGGWSLGGILALEMAALLLGGGDDGVEVLGVVMVDSICPVYAAREGAVVTTARGGFSAHTSPETVERVEWCFAEARRAVAAYVPPRRWADNECCSSGSTCPPVVLLRAGEAFPVAAAGEVSFVDVARHDRALGWDAYRRGLFVDVVDVPGHHFNIFAFEHVDHVSDALAAACQRLEGRRRLRID